MDSKAFDFAEYTRIAISCPKDGVLHRNTPKPVGLAVAAAHARFETKVKFGHIPSTLLRDQHSCTSKQKLVLRRTETMVATLGDPAKLDSKLYSNPRTGKVPCLEIALCSCESHRGTVCHSVDREISNSKFH